MAEINTVELAPLVLEPLNHAMAAAARQALKMGIPAHNIIEIFLNQLASVVAMVEPPGARQKTIEGLVESFGPMVKKHVDMRYTTPGGLVLPRPTDSLLPSPS